MSYINDNIITSSQNRKVREVILLSQKSRERARQKLFVVEGLREVKACIDSGFAVTTVFHCPKIIPTEEIQPVLSGKIENRRVFEVSEDVYAHIAYRAGTEGIIAIVEEKPRTLFSVAEKLSDIESPLILVAEKVEKPGNIGAILRTADACGVDAVLLCDCPTDIYNPNLIRASLGGVFTQNIAECTTSEAIDYLKNNNIAIYTAQLQDSLPYYDTDMTKACAIVMGSEADGITTAWREASDKKVLIPMLGKLDSLNVSVSAAILCYEALRQRTQHK